MGIRLFFREFFGETRYGAGSLGEGVHIQGGSGAKGGDLVLEAGGTNAPSGGTNGSILLPSIPTANPYVKDALWNNAGAISIAHDPIVPVNTVAPAITGTAQDTQTLTCSTGTWTGDPAATLTYQWKAAGVAIGGATGTTYLVVTGDIGKVITCTVTGTNIAGTASVTTAGTAAVIA